ncbi:protein of unknown function DUF364 [Syntrophotalea carbinolica DSM 2380]|uniref:Heavy-metal chelation domain-containing protein n=1 Tax=Syntrophotalea carbinolica (strain DSM 2380 / NBRC 103641 / GraBd1) TaxID=338963 RepID=Q3A6G7_SYNC1|nr:DUF364 domain-containing protein [Syntrophotalea carbinolica]ABA88040.1 protein of unknown function DUF364 [Syntrophotalea carbinolica DSM 2380]
MSLRKDLIASVRNKCPDSLSVKVQRFVKTPVCDTKIPPFTVAVLENGAVGFSYNLFHRDDQAMQRYVAWDPDEIVGKTADEIMSWLLTEDTLKKTAGLAVLNALSQDFLNTNPGAYRLDTESDLFDILRLDKSSRVGVVGFFRPMMDKLVEKAGEVVVVELSEDLREGSHPFTMTDDPEALRGCDKILITATTVLNDSLLTVIPHCIDAAFVAMMGPTAGFLPDTVFALGVDAVGFTRVKDLDLFLERFSSGGKWGEATSKIWAMPAR